MPAIAHNHDYWWERDRFTGCVIPEVLDASFPPALPNVHHVSISSLAAASLRDRRGLESAVIPNVFDFGHPMPRPRPDVRRDLRTELGMGETGLLIVQPTRVVPRKGIELTIDLAGRLGDPDAVVLITSPAGDEGLDYLIALERQAERAKVNLRYAADRFAPDHEGRPIGPAHSLTEAYAAADLIAYPSLYEGFGNALLEAVFFGKPVFVNRYPVYEADIRPLGFRFVEIDGVVTDAAADAVRSLLADPARQAADAEHNFAIGQAHLGYGRLEQGLAELLKP
jgi:glycosyltransferase involved in cell wall biosynthesis